MKKRIKLVGIVVIGLVAGMFLVLSAAPRNINIPANAPTVIFNRTLKSSSISWGACCKKLTFGEENIDSPLTFTCPSGTCTLSAEINVQLEGSGDSSNLWSLGALVDGNAMNEPTAFPFLGNIPVTGYMGGSWTANMSKIPAGKHTVQSFVSTNFGGQLDSYGITYRLYQP